MKRKITSILAADVVEFSRLVADDEEDTLARLVSAQAVFGSHVASHGGRIFNTAGDAILAEFPSAVEAVRAALAIQDGWRQVDNDAADGRRLWFRMGIGIGDVVEHGTDLLGDGVNIAARLQGLAPPGGLALSHWVQEQIAGKVNVPLIDIGLQDLKNIPKPVRVAVVDPSGHWGALGQPSPIASGLQGQAQHDRASSSTRSWLASSRTIVGLSAAFAVGLVALITLRPKRVPSTDTVDPAIVAPSAPVLAGGPAALPVPVPVPAPAPATPAPSTPPSPLPTPVVVPAPAAIPAPASMPSAAPKSEPMPAAFPTLIPLPPPAALPEPLPVKLPDRPTEAPAPIIMPPVIIDPPDFATVPPSLTQPSTVTTPVQPAVSLPDTTERKQMPIRPQTEPKRLPSIEKKSPTK